MFSRAWPSVSPWSSGPWACPFFQWKKVGKAFLTEKAKSPKAAPMMVNSTGLWLPGKGYFVSVNASTKVCTKPETTKLAPSLK